MEYVENGSLWDIKEHLPFLYQSVIDLQAKTILELGVKDGNSTRVFLEGLEETHGILVSVDINDCSKVADSLNFKFIQSDSRNEDLLEILKPYVPFDILFIDTAHTYPLTMIELERFSPFVRDTGIILLHDTISSTGHAVLKAIEDFIKDKPYNFEHRKNNNGLGILRKNL